MKQKRMNFSRMGKTLVAALISAALLLPTVGTAVQASDILSSQTETVQVIRPYITGMETVGTELKGMYTYYDVNGRPEAGSSFRWLRCDTKLGEYTEIPGATGSNYTLTPEDAGKYIRFEVTTPHLGRGGQRAAELDDRPSAHSRAVRTDRQPV